MRHRRDRRERGSAGAAQRHLCRDRGRLAQATNRSRLDCGKENMSATVRILLSVGAIVVAALAIGFWVIRRPGPLAFVDGPKVALTAYHGPNPPPPPAPPPPATLL